eukprot:TRINITY_DN2993_c0_g1_i1.p1 TRINITY_DN2993_c0_g1~~TRINITY_DN2993_c0_g1_i1.p1  ORF type:complete len:252 (+),score=76.20 TRINITY_DN2993_c0_g1_i1:77-832(+)
MCIRDRVSTQSTGETDWTMSIGIKTFYTASFAPNPQLVDIFAREKGIDLESIEKQVNILINENRSPEMLKINPAGQVPFFEMDDGKGLSDTIAMCEYLEDVKPEPALIGTDPATKANTRMWQRRMEEHFVYPTFEAFRFWTESDDCAGDFKGIFAGKSPMLLPQVWREMREWALVKLRWLEEQKKDSPSEFVAGDDFSVVDCQMYITLSFFAIPGFGDFLTDNAAELPWTVAYMERLKDCLLYTSPSPRDS